MILWLLLLKEVIIGFTWYMSKTVNGMKNADLSEKTGQL